MKSKCSVDGCKNLVDFKFPSDFHLRKEWLKAIQKPDFAPKSCNGLCSKHFKFEDVLTKNVSFGYELARVHLRRGAIPSIFSWSKKNTTDDGDDDSVPEKQEDNECSVKKSRDYDLLTKTNSIFDFGIDVYEETVSTNNYKEQTLQNSNPDNVQSVHVNDENGERDHENHAYNPKKKRPMKKPLVKPRYDIEELIDKPAVILEFTGLEDYHKFMTVFYSLEKKVHMLRIQGNRTHGCLSLKNQLFLTLWKLRKNCTGIELAIHFNITKIAVHNIFKSWIQFMSHQWSKIDAWPSKELVRFYMPDNFKMDFPNTRVIIDGTEIHVERSKNPLVQQSTFSYYKNDTTLKTVVGKSPGGLISFSSELYGGSTSDRQVVERCTLKHKCESGDMIMADRGFTVQDIFAPYNVTVAIPHFTKGKGYIPLQDLLSDRKLSKYRVHVERVIGQMKTFKIFSSRLNHKYLPIASDMLKVIIMLCNFRDSIMSKKVSEM